MNESIFKAYDIRGRYPEEINENFAYTIGLSYGSYLKEYLDKNKCVIGMDNRLSSLSLKAALKNVVDKGLTITDDCSAVEQLGMTVALTAGSFENIKVTTPVDVSIAEAILERRGEL